VAAAFACVAVEEDPDPPQAVRPSAATAPAASATLSGRPSASLICCIKSLVSLRVISTLPCLLAEQHRSFASSTGAAASSSSARFSAAGASAAG
jgi:hypothetical protein